MPRRIAGQTVVGMPDRIPEVQSHLTRLLKAVDKDESDNFSNEAPMIKARADIRRSTRELIAALSRYMNLRFGALGD